MPSYISGMSIELNSANNSSGVTGITIQKSCHVYIQMNIYCFQMCNSICRCGFLAHKSSHLVFDGIQASHQYNGIVLLETNNTIVTDSILSYSRDYGVRMLNTDTVNLFNTAITHNLNGIHVYGARNTKMEKMDFSYIMNLSLGVEIMHSINVHISDIYGTSSDTFTFVRNCQSAEKGIRSYDGISIEECTNVFVNFVFSSKLTLWGR